MTFGDEIGSFGSSANWVTHIYSGDDCGKSPLARGDANNKISKDGS